MSEQDHPGAEASPLPDAVRAVLVDAFARALLRDLRDAGVLPQPTTDAESRETKADRSQDVNMDQR